MPLIVIVDDRATNIGIFAKLAATIGPDVQVKTFGDPKQALAWMAQTTPDLVMTDYQMPQMDGADFIAEMRQVPSLQDVPSVVISVHDDRTFRLRALESGATDFLNSPVDHHEFVTRARNLLSLRQHQLALADRAQALEQALLSSHKPADDLVRKSQSLMQQVMDASPCLIHATDTQGLLILSNAAHAKFLGCDARTLMGKPLADILPADVVFRHDLLDRLVLARGQTIPDIEDEWCDAAGAMATFETTKTPLLDARNQVVGVVSTLRNISAHKQRETELLGLAQSDSVTGLPNATKLNLHLRSCLAEAQRGQNLFALHRLQLGGLTDIVNLLGHGVEHDLLRHIAERLQATTRSTDCVARLEGHGFAIVQSGITQLQDVAAFAGRLLGTLSTIEGVVATQISPKVSVGVVCFPDDGADAATLMHHADLALVRAKAEPGNRFCFYKLDLQTRLENDALLVAELGRALQHQQCVLHYQPHVSLASGRVSGAEAVLCWDRPGFGPVSQPFFWAQAEAHGLAAPLQSWALRQACTQAALWHARGFSQLRVALHIAASLWQQRGLPDLVQSVLQETGLDPASLDLEMSCDVMAGADELQIADMRALKALGLGLTVSDCGFRPLSAQQLQACGLDRLKLHPALVRDVLTHSQDARLVQSLITLGHALQLDVVAAGVDTRAHLQHVQRAGCDEVQGSYFSAPVSVEELETLLLDEPDLCLKVA